MPAVVTAAVLLVGLQGCAAVALTLLSAGAGVGASAGIDHTMNGVAYRTFTAGQEHVRRATLAALRRMAISVKTDDNTEEGRKIVAEAADRMVEIGLERITPKTTRMRVVVRQGLFFRDRSTAGEIITKTEQAISSSGSETAASGGTETPRSSGARVSRSSAGTQVSRSSGTEVAGSHATETSRRVDEER